MSISPSAKKIANAVLDALQSADELGGVDDRADYIALMDYLAQECRKRAETAEANAPEKQILAFIRSELGADDAEIWPTGGGCTAIGIPINGSDTHWLLTQDASAPESMVEPTSVGYYGKDDTWVCFDCENVPEALKLIRSFVSASF